MTIVALDTVHPVKKRPWARIRMSYEKSPGTECVNSSILDRLSPGLNDARVGMVTISVTGGTSKNVYGMSLSSSGEVRLSCKLVKEAISSGLHRE